MRSALLTSTWELVWELGVVPNPTLYPELDCLIFLDFPDIEGETFPLLGLEP